MNKKKKSIFLIISLILLLVSVLIFYVILPVKKAPKTPDGPVPTNEITTNDLVNPYRFKDIIVEYRQDSNLLIVFYKNSLEEAKIQSEELTEKIDSQNLKEAKKEFIKLEREEEEPPPGYGQ